MRLRWGRFLGWLTLLLILGILGLIWGGSWLLLQIIKESKEEELGKRLQAMGEIFSRELDDYAVLLEDYVVMLAEGPAPQYEDSPLLQKLRQLLNELRKRQELQGVMLVKDGQVLLDAEGEFTVGEQWEILRIDQQEYEQAAAGRSAVSPFYRVDNLPYKRAYVPVSEPNGTVVCVLRLEGSRDYLKSLVELRSYFYLIMGIVSVILLGLGGIFYHLQWMWIQAGERMATHDRLQSLGMLSAAVAHQLRNPLGIIRGAAENIVSETDKEVVREFGQDIVEESDRLEELLRQFLGLLRPRVGEEETAEVKEEVEQTLRLVGDLLGRSGITFTVQLPAESVMVKIPGSFLRQVLFNLMLNARDSMPQGGEIAIRGTRKARRFFQLQVRDNGTGIDKKNVRHIFDPFFSTKNTGMGLGLFISRYLVESTGGKMWIESRQDQGTSVYLQLVRKEG